MVKRDEKIKEFSFKIKLLVNESQKVASLQSQVTARDVELNAMHMAVLRFAKALEEMTRDYASFRLELDALHATEDVGKVCHGTFQKGDLLATVGRCIRRLSVAVTGLMTYR